MAVLFPFRHNWRRPYVVEREFKTSIIESRDYTEQRVAERTYPRMRVQMEPRLAEGDLARLNAFLAKNQQGDILIVDEAAAMITAAPADGALTALVVEEVPDWLLVGMTVYATYGGLQQELKVADIDGTTLIMTGPVVQDWPTGTLLNRVLRARFDPRQTGRRISGTYGTTEVAFDITSERIDTASATSGTNGSGAVDAAGPGSFGSDGSPTNTFFLSAIPYSSTIAFPDFTVTDVKAYRKRIDAGKVTVNLQFWYRAWNYGLLDGDAANAAWNLELACYDKDGVALGPVAGEGAFTASGNADGATAGSLVRTVPPGTRSIGVRGRLILTFPLFATAVVELAEATIEFDSANFQIGGTLPGENLLAKRPDIASEVPRFEWESFLEIIDFDRGAREFYAPTTYQKHMLRLGFLGQTAAEVDEITGLFDAMRGRQGTFIMPTWADDLGLGVTGASGASTLLAPGRWVYDSYAGDPVFNRLYVDFYDQPGEFFRVTGIALDGNNDSVLTLDAALPADVSYDTARVVCFAPRWRFAADQLSVEWLTDQVAQISATVMTLPDEVPA